MEEITKANMRWAKYLNAYCKPVWRISISSLKEWRTNNGPYLKFIMPWGKWCPVVLRRVTQLPRVSAVHSTPGWSSLLHFTLVMRSVNCDDADCLKNRTCFCILLWVWPSTVNLIDEYDTVECKMVTNTRDGMLWFKGHRFSISSL